MTDIKPIETEYAGYKFRSRLEARWAVFFDACGVDWEYEPQGYTLQDGTKYLPDFLLHGVELDSLDLHKEETDLYVEVKGVVTDDAKRKLVEFSGLGDYERIRDERDGDVYDPDVERACISRPIIAFGRVPDGNRYEEIIENIEKQTLKSHSFLFSVLFITGTLECECSLVPYINNNGKLAFSDNFCRLADSEFVGDCIDNFISNADIDKTKVAYKKARQARFEWGETPRRCTVK